MIPSDGFFPAMIPAEQPLNAKDQPDSSSTSEPAYLVVGKLRRPHGVRGEMQMEVLTDFPERLQVGVQVFVGETRQPLRLRRCRPQDQTLLLSFDGYPTPEAVGEFRNQLVYVRADDRPPLPVGEYYQHQMIGLNVVSDEGRILGQVKEILETGANDVFVVQPEMGPDVLLPVIASVILEVNLDQRQIKVHLLPGLMPE
jgi:16S rRNA processing protein RimM